MSTANGPGKDDRQGIDMLRTAIENVAAEIEARPAKAPVRASRWGLYAAVGVAAVLIALLVGSWLIAPSRSSEIEVLVLRIHGQDVRARIVDGTAPATIIVIPQPPQPRPPVGASVAFGGAR